MKTPPSPVYQLRIALQGIRPPIWRQLLLPGSLPLCCVHDVLQVAMGWTDSHLHQFEKDGQYWGLPENYEFDDIDVIDERDTPLCGMLPGEGSAAVYVYDFGDDWRHELTVEQILPPPQTAVLHPQCVTGERHCPPEDVGGVHGYQEFLEVIFDPNHEEFQNYVGWAGGPFQAEEFSAGRVNRILSRMRFPRRHRR